MNVRRFDSLEAWRTYRLGKIMGSSVKEFIGPGRSEVKPGIWRAAAESIIGSAALAESEFTASQWLQRGHDLEPAAIRRFEEVTGKKVNRGLVAWESEDDPRLAVSPDGPIGKTEVVEVKSLLSPKHVEAIFTGDIPKNTSGYEEQRIKHFIINKKLRKHHTAFFHPDFPAPLDLFVVTVTRKDLAKQIAAQEAAEREAAAKIREVVNKLTMYAPEDVAKVEAVKEELLADATV